MTPKKRLIEWDLPLADISEESAREKNIRQGLPSTMHIWWARKPLAASRAIAFAAITSDPGEDHQTRRNELRKLISQIIPWEAVSDDDSIDIKKARELVRDEYLEYPKVLDPFAGGGSIPLELLRLGCETYTLDYNPVAILLQRSILEWPEKYSHKYQTSQNQKNITHSQLGFYEHEKKDENLLYFLVDKWVKKIFSAVHDELLGLFPIGEDGWEIVGYLWARTVHCMNPSCKAELPLINLSCYLKR